MKRKEVVKVKNGEARIVSTKRWEEFTSRLNDPEAAALAGGGACEDACEEHEGVETCGRTYVVCNDGTAYLIDP